MILFSFTQVKTVRNSAPLYQRDLLLLILNVTGERSLNVNTHLHCCACVTLSKSHWLRVLSFIFLKETLSGLALVSEAWEEHAFPEVSSSKPFFIYLKKI